MSGQTNQPNARRILGDPLAIALGVSLIAHVLIGGTWWIGQRQGWWQASRMPAWVAAVRAVGGMDRARVEKAMEKRPQPESQLTFLEVDPVAQPQEPENAQHYGAVSTRAANRTRDPDASNRPKVDGREQDFLKATADGSQKAVAANTPKAVPLQPSRAQVEPVDSSSDTDSEAGQRPDEDAGDTRMAKAVPRTGQGMALGEAGKGQAAQTQRRARPKSLIEALARQGGVPGDRTTVSGGVPELGKLAFDVKGSPFGIYDTVFIETVRNNWFHILGTQVIGGSGVVKIRFNLHHDGRVSAVRVEETSVNDLLTLYCRTAIEIGAAYEEWPTEMRREIGSNIREVTFTFRYL